METYKLQHTKHETRYKYMILTTDVHFHQCFQLLHIGLKPLDCLHVFAPVLRLLDLKSNFGLY